MPNKLWLLPYVGTGMANLAVHPSSVSKLVAASKQWVNTAEDCGKAMRGRWMAGGVAYAAVGVHLQRVSFLRSRRLGSII
jgi:hypothetical protein